ncbi:MAG: hypothetical protein QME62_06060, partial [Armatimonadota bacterium]|nr:hypothetical protein [Armatimonadota bacterium]
AGVQIVLLQQKLRILDMIEDVLLSRRRKPNIAFYVTDFKNIGKIKRQFLLTYVIMPVYL